MRASQPQCTFYVQGRLDPHLQIESRLLLAHAAAEEVDAGHSWWDAAQHCAHCVLGHLLWWRCGHIQPCSRVTDLTRQENQKNTSSCIIYMCDPWVTATA